MGIKNNILFKMQLNSFVIDNSVLRGNNSYRKFYTVRLKCTVMKRKWKQ